MKKILLSAAFFIVTPLMLLASLTYLSYYSYSKAYPSSQTSRTGTSVAFAALPSQDTSIEGELSYQDARTESLRSFFKKNNSPLEPYAQNFIDNAEKYNLDFRLMPAIAMQESNLCKKSPKDSFNCWGFGVYGKKVTRFESFEEGIESVAKTLSEKYHSIGLISPEEIMTKYTPSNNGDWAKSVNYFMGQL
jgi:hypothetical protein